MAFSIDKWNNTYSKNSTSCIDLIFTDQENFSINSGVHSSLNPNCHHQIVHCSFNPNIHYQPPYQRLVWDYKKVNPITIRKAIDEVNWERLFHGKNINEQVTSFNGTVLNFFKNYVPNKYITIDDRDPVWINDTIKSKIKTKNLLFKQYMQNDRSSHQRCSMKKGVLRNFTKFTRKRLRQSLFFKKFAGLWPSTLLKKKLWYRCFSVNFVKFPRTPFLQNTSGRLLLEWEICGLWLWFS